MTNILFPQSRQSDRPVIIAGPCMAEGWDLLQEVAETMTSLVATLDVDFIFKASFDKANRTSVKSYRGPGLDVALAWFAELKSKYPNLKILTDIHEAGQAAAVAEVCDVLQIPAFLCRQSDLIEAAVRTGKAVNVKKGQFLSPGATAHIVGKVREVAEASGIQPNVALTERGTTFGYGDLVVDMRGLRIMAATGAPVIFDVTHSTQQPASGAAQGVSGGARATAPLLARAAIASGYANGLFLEVHPNPSQAMSDAATQLNISQAEGLIQQLVPLWYHMRTASDLDQSFT